MSKSRRSTFNQVSAVTRLLVDVVLIRDDEHAWKSHLIQGLCQLFGAREGPALHCAHWAATGEVALVSVVGGGTPDPMAAPLMRDFHRDCSPREDPVLDELTRQSMKPQAHRVSRLVGMERLYRSSVYDRVGRPIQCGDSLVGFCPLPAPGEVFGVIVHRTRSDRLFGERERGLYALCFEELARLHAHGVFDPSPRQRLPAMPPREKQILELLIRGEGWKQIAVQLGLSRHTVTGYAKRLFLRMNVNSRAELAALFVEQNSK